MSGKFLGGESMKTIRIGTRSSRLALIQTQYVIDAIHEVDPSTYCKIVAMESLGDRMIEKPLNSFGRNGVFCDEIERAILNDEIDLAVHSSKDMSFELPEELEIMGTLKREDPRELLITNRQQPHRKDKKIIRIGTCSVRRQTQIEAYLPNIQCVSLRGDVETRLNKLASGMYDGIILAAAGIKRLGLQEDSRFHFQYYSIGEFVPAPGQGIIAIEGKRHSQWKEIIDKISDPVAFEELRLERSLYRRLTDDDNSPSSVHVQIKKILESVTVGKSADKDKQIAEDKEEQIEEEQIAEDKEEQIEEEQIAEEKQIPAEEGHVAEKEEFHNQEIEIWVLFEEKIGSKVKHFQGNISDTVKMAEQYIEMRRQTV